MKTSSTFKMNKSTKRMLTLFNFKTSSDRTNFKKNMIAAQLYSEFATRTTDKSNKDSDNG